MFYLTDMHCHLLPGVDDGSQSMEETIAAMKEAERQGIRRMIITPHFHPGRYVVKGRKVLEILDDVRETCRKNGIDIELYPGQECCWFSELIDVLKAGDALTLNGTRFVLVEFDPRTIFNGMVNAIQTLTLNNYQPIIAHFERYDCLNGRQDYLDELRNLGAYLQLNFDTILAKDSLFHRNPWRKLLQEGYVDFLGSDTHGTHFRPLHADKAIQWLQSHTDEDLLYEILEQNPDMILE